MQQSGEAGCEGEVSLGALLRLCSYISVADLGGGASSTPPPRTCVFAILNVTFLALDVPLNISNSAQSLLKILDPLLNSDNSLYNHNGVQILYNNSMAMILKEFRKRRSD